MRELLAARPGRDGIVTGPASRARGGPTLLARLGGTLATRPAVVAGTIVVTACGAAIAVNALTFQRARHPAPLFAERPRAAAEAPAPVKRVEPPRAELPAAPPLPPARPLPAAAPAAAPAPPPARRDHIGDLLRGGEATGAVARQGSAESGRSLAGAQRALVKLGYGPLTADGVKGPATRAALERFERDRRLPPTGELNPRTARELAAASGLSLD
ncbi:MAG TPA: peptidoglycan-binding domain-containing protein [Salinarimonas sp.]|nr:peptidoglycan-binding domain-containing protein [Salinarimonas sp.]